MYFYIKLSCYSYNKKSAATIRFFDRGDYFSLHGSDALYAAKEFFKTNNVIKIWKSSSGCKKLFVFKSKFTY